MTASCQPLPRSVAEEMLQVVARALCDRAGDTPAQRDGRTRQMVHATLGLAPRDGLEFMLATLAFGHFQIILDSMGDVFRGQADALKAKTKTAIVPLGRAMLEMLRELRLVQHRPVLASAEDAATEAGTEAEPPQTTAPLPPEAEIPMPDSDELSLTDPRLGLPEEVIAWMAGKAPAVLRTAAPANCGSAETPPVPEQSEERTAALPGNVFAAMQPKASSCDIAERPAWQDPGKAVAAHAAHNVSDRETLATVHQTRAKVPAQDKVAAGA